MKTVLVTGGNGQLAQCLKDLVSSYSNFNFIFKDSSELDITNKLEIQSFFSKNKIAWCINCAAYTKVDLAEVNEETAFSINVKGVKNIAEACEIHDVKLIHISTDFVFDGNSKKPYLEIDTPNPINNYGLSKLKGELAVKTIHQKHFIIRTSWLYSEFGNNFVKTMLRLSEEKNEISIVNDQLGSPTYARDLAAVILNIIKEDLDNFGTYHYCNEGQVTWFDFAQAIFRITNKTIKLIPVASKGFKTLAERPKYSMLNSTKIKNTLQLEIPNWRKGLKTTLVNLKKQE